VSPFQGDDDGKVVWPDEVSRHRDIHCLECGDPLHIVAGFWREDGSRVARHFSHNPSASSRGICHGGESDEHELMKYIVKRQFQEMFDHGTITLEKAIPETDRIGDVVVEFDQEFDTWGRGVIAEVQYLNKSKDFAAVTHDYIRAGFSVFWLNESHFTADYEQVDLPDEVPAWPNAVPTVGEWSGIEQPFAELPEFGQRHSMEITVPYEHVEKHRDKLLQTFTRNRDLADLGGADLVHPLEDGNAPRSCSSCGQDALYYIYTKGVISTFRCTEHLPGAGEVQLDEVAP